MSKKNYECMILDLPASEIENFTCANQEFPRGNTPYLEWLMDMLEKLRRRKTQKTRYDRWVKENPDKRRLSQRAWWRSKSTFRTNGP